MKIWKAMQRWDLIRW